MRYLNKDGKFEAKKVFLKKKLESTNFCLVYSPFEDKSVEDEIIMVDGDNVCIPENLDKMLAMREVPYKIKIIEFTKVQLKELESMIKIDNNLLTKII